jgi:small subunit ribosomal protein S19e
MASINDVNATELIEKAAIELQKNENIKAPEWANYVKTGRAKERVPARKDWWYIRSAAVLRTIHSYGPIGVSKLKVKYGSKKRRGYKPSKFYPGSGNIIRKILQQLEKAGYLKKEEKMQHKGRVVTPAGKSFLDKLATQIYKNTVKEMPKPKVEEKKIEKEAVVKKVEEKKVEEKAKVEKSEEKKGKEEKKPAEKEAVAKKE